MTREKDEIEVDEEKVERTFSMFLKVNYGSETKFSLEMNLNG